MSRLDRLFKTCLVRVRLGKVVFMYYIFGAFQYNGSYVRFTKSLPCCLGRTLARTRNVTVSPESGNTVTLRVAAAYVTSSSNSSEGPPTCCPILWIKAKKVRDNNHEVKGKPQEDTEISYVFSLQRLETRTLPWNGNAMNEQKTRYCEEVRKLCKYRILMAPFCRKKSVKLILKSGGESCMQTMWKNTL